MFSDQPSNSSRHQSAPAKLTGVVLTDKELGRGSDAVVQEADYQGTVCAAKQLHKILLKDQLPGGAQRFRDNFDEEIRKWCELKHPHIVLLLGVYYEVKSPVPILILEKMQTSLRRYIETHKKEAVPIPDKIFILRQVSQALAYLHGRQQPLVHHDLSPNNILLNQGSLLTKITDFGMSRIVDSSHSTRKSSMKGTLAFMSPEALSIPLKYTEKLDIFSFGNVVLFALTHVWPELGPSVVYEGNKAVAVEEFERREQYTKSLTTKEQSSFFPMIQSCLQNRPDRRPTSFQLVQQMRQMEGAHPRLDCSNTIAQLIEQLKKKDSQLEEKDDHLKVKDLHIQKLTKRVEELSEEVEAQKQRDIGLKRDMDKLFAEKIAELESENLTEQNRLLQTQLNAASMEYQGLKESTERTISSLKEQLHAAYMEHDDLKENIEHMKASRDRWRSEEVDQLKKNLEEAQKTIRSLEDPKKHSDTPDNGGGGGDRRDDERPTMITAANRQSLNSEDEPVTSIDNVGEAVEARTPREGSHGSRFATGSTPSESPVVTQPRQCFKQHSAAHQEKVKKSVGSTTRKNPSSSNSQHNPTQVSGVGSLLIQKSKKSKEPSSREPASSDSTRCSQEPTAPSTLGSPTPPAPGNIHSESSLVEEASLGLLSVDNLKHTAPGQREESGRHPKENEQTQEPSPPHPPSCEPPPEADTVVKSAVDVVERSGEWLEVSQQPPSDGTKRDVHTQGRQVSSAADSNVHLSNLCDEDSSNQSQASWESRELVCKLKEELKVEIEQEMERNEQKLEEYRKKVKDLEKEVHNEKQLKQILKNAQERKGQELAASKKEVNGLLKQLESERREKEKQKTEVNALHQENESLKARMVEQNTFSSQLKAKVHDSLSHTSMYEEGYLPIPAHVDLPKQVTRQAHGKMWVKSDFLQNERFLEQVRRHFSDESLEKHTPVMYDDSDTNSILYPPANSTSLSAPGRSTTRSLEEEGKRRKWKKDSLSPEGPKSFDDRSIVTLHSVEANDLTESAIHRSLEKQQQPQQYGRAAVEEFQQSPEQTFEENQKQVQLQQQLQHPYTGPPSETHSDGKTKATEPTDNHISTLRKQLNTASVEYQGLKESTERTISSLKEQLHAAYMEHDDLKENIEHMKASRDRWRSEEVDQLKKNLEEAQNTIRSLEDELEVAMAWYSGEHARVKELTKEMRRHEMAQNSRKHLEEQIQKLTKRVEELLEEVEARKQHENGLKRDMDRLFTEKTELESENLTARLQMDMFKNDFEQERKDREGAHDKFADQEKEWMENIQRSADEKDNLMAASMQLKEEILDLKHKLDNDSKMCKRQADMIKKQEAESRKQEGEQKKREAAFLKRIERLNQEVQKYQISKVSADPKATSEYQGLHAEHRQTMQQLEATLAAKNVAGKELNTLRREFEMLVDRSEVQVESQTGELQTLQHHYRILSGEVAKLREENTALKRSVTQPQAPSGTSALSQEYHQSLSTSQGQGNSPHRFRDQGKYGTTDYDFELTNPKLNQADYDINMHRPIPMPGGEPSQLPNQPWPRGDQQPRPHGDQQPRSRDDHQLRPHGDQQPRPHGNQPRPRGDQQPRPRGDQQPRPHGNQQPRPRGDQQPRPHGDQQPRSRDDHQLRPPADLDQGNKRIIEDPTTLSGDIEEKDSPPSSSERKASGGSQQANALSTVPAQQQQQQQWQQQQQHQGQWNEQAGMSSSSSTAHYTPVHTTPHIQTRPGALKPSGGGGVGKGIVGLSSPVARGNQIPQSGLPRSQSTPHHTPERLDSESDDSFLPSPMTKVIHPFSRQLSSPQPPPPLQARTLGHQEQEERIYTPEGSETAFGRGSSNQGKFKKSYSADDGKRGGVDRNPDKVMIDRGTGDSDYDHRQHHKGFSSYSSVGDRDDVFHHRSIPEENQTPRDASLSSQESFFQPNQQHIGENINREIRKEASDYRKHAERGLPASESIDEGAWPYDPNLQCKHCGKKFRQGQIREFRYHVDDEHAPSMMS